MTRRLRARRARRSPGTGSGSSSSRSRVFVALLFVLQRTRARPADARGDAEPPHGGLDGHPHALDRRADLRPRLRHRRASPASRCRRSTMSRPISARATSSTASWSSCSAASAISGARWSAPSRSASPTSSSSPIAGAVLGKIVAPRLIILFIQKRPRGLFALKGRAVEA